MLLGVDVGGTFTDAVLALPDGRVVTAKAPSTPDDQSEGVMAAVGAVLGRAGCEAREVTFFAHGMTVATNALLEGRGARTALLATEGFADVVELARQNRVDLYRLCATRPPPLTPPERRFEVPERMTPQGPVRGLEPQAARAVAERVAGCEPEAVAVVLLHSYAHPEHEQSLRDALAQVLPDVHISLSHELVGTFREYERAATTEIDAALSPLLAGYLRRLRASAADQGVPEPAIMQSNGGLIDADSAAGHAALTVLSGPAAGAAGAAHVAQLAGAGRALGLDMGGTSCDVCVIRDGAVAEQGAAEIAGRPLALPMLDVHTVGAGGGSIAWRDPGGALRVGPQSAGAVPGPACYGRGGSDPTVTDANLVLGRLGADAPLAGGVQLDPERAAAAVGALAEELGLGVRECAEGILRVANAEMVRALRVVTVERGIDPRAFGLLAFGGAGPLHAAAIAAELGIRTVLCPGASGVLAALGLVVSPRRRDAQRTVLLAGAELTAGAVRSAVAALGDEARRALGGSGEEAELRSTFELRYRGQSFELAISPESLEPSPAELRELFDAAHEDRYGYRDSEQELELVTLRVSAFAGGAPGASGEVPQAPAAAPGATPAAAPGATPAAAPGATPAAAPGAEGAPSARRTAVIDGTELELTVLRGIQAPGTRIEGPAVVELPEATLLVPPGWSGAADATGTIRIEAAG
jgi:N-methylhydantoinase A